MSISQVLNSSSADETGPLRAGCEVTFLDEFRILATYSRNLSDVPELVVFNTLLPQDHPRSFRRLNLPLKYLGWDVHIHLDLDGSLGIANRDEPLIADQNQAVLLVELSSMKWRSEVFLIVQTRLLIEHVCSLGAEVRIPWNEWGRGAVVMGVANCGIQSSVVAHATRVIVFSDIGDHELGQRYHIHIFDFTHRGRATLPLSTGDEGEIKRTAAFEDGKSCALKWDFDLGDLNSLGDSVVISVVSMLSLFYHVVD